ncbi:hypothetical protein Hanom_Chr13g01226231 [Helianthus anomalus]
MMGKPVSSELHGNSRMHDRSVDRENIGKGGNGSVLEGGERSNDDVFMANPSPQGSQTQDSKEVGSLSGSGAEVVKKGVFFFNSDNRHRPNNHKVRIRPRSGAVSQRGSRSPTPGERPVEKT